jgi:hypothetical protein
MGSVTSRTLLGHLVSFASLAVFAALASAGCNTILGNELGTARSPLDGGSSFEGGAPIDGGILTQSCDTSAGNKVCFGLCVKIDQPNTGCGGTACDACDPKNVNAAVCKGAGSTLGCAFDACKAGFDSCDNDPTNGCETSLNARTSCGSCNTVCDGAAPLCALTDGVYGCVSSCPVGTQDCSGACVDTTTSTENCGGCEIKCRRAAASATCVNSECKYLCNPGTHECGNLCVQDTNPNACGPTCTVCPAGGPHTARSCVLGACSVACDPDWLDCDGVLFNGCEYNGNSCPIVTGPCGGTCTALEQCCGGVCIPHKDPCGVTPPPRF